MKNIEVIKNPDDSKLEEMGVKTWDIWTKEVSDFPWTYDSTEMCYFLEGDVEVTPKNENPVRIVKGDLVTFKKGLVCTWKVRKPVKKHYIFEE